MKNLMNRVNRIAATILLVLRCSSFSYALPSGESVVAGEASFDRSTADTLTVSTPSDKLIVNYDSFNIASPETVAFVQPSSSSIALNPSSAAILRASWGL